MKLRSVRLGLPAAIVLVCIFASSTATAQTIWHVDDDACPNAGIGIELDPFCSIQVAIDAAATSGDEIRVAPGTYFEAISILEKGVHLRSSGGADVTTIDAGGLDTTVVTCVDSLGNETRLEGFTITGGTGVLSANPGLGGGMYVAGASPTIKDCIFIGNSGPGIASEYSDVTVTFCTFEKNTAPYGAGIFHGGGRIRVSSCDFIQNETSLRAGAMETYDADALITDCTFRGNTSVSGGAVYARGRDPTHYVNCLFERNAAVNGGAAFIEVASARFTSCTFNGNSATVVEDSWLGGRGGAIHGENYGAVALENSIFTGNVAYAGGAIWNTNQGMILTNCTITGNTAIEHGGAIRIWHAGEVSTVVNSVLWGNVAGSEGAQIFSSYSPSNPEISHSLIEGSGGSGSWNIHFGADVGGNIDTDPMFVREPDSGGDGWGDDSATPDVDEGANDDYGDLHVQLGSPCINEGNDSAVPADLSTDFDGADRIQRCRVDMGPYETDFVGRDCDGNGSVDACDVADGLLPDCNGNQVPDECDIAAGVSADCNDNFIPDECEPSAFSSVVYVDDSAPPGGDGRAWHSAFSDLQDALRLAPCEATGEIRVAGGIYRPGSSRTDRFVVRGSVRLLGGFAGVGSDTPDARDFETHETVLSGDIGGLGDSSDNSYRVLEIAHVDAETVIEGFTICDGRADGNNDYTGAGLYIWSASPTIRSCVFRDNWAFGVGGGLYSHTSSPIFNDCTIASNTGEKGGGGMFITGPGRPVLTECWFIGNAAARNDRFGAGGGLKQSGDGTVELRNCEFIDNVATHGGGAYGHGSGTVVLDACWFKTNTADDFGGALSLSSGSGLVTDCIFFGNTARMGGGLHFDASGTTVRNTVFVANSAAESGSAIYNQTLSSTFSNCIISANGSNAITPGSPVTFSIVSGGYSGEGVFSFDPMFVREPNDGGDGWGDDPDTPDVNEGANDDYGDLRLHPLSGCINSGDPAFVPDPGETDLNGHPRVLCGRVDMGAYEFGIGDHDCNRVVGLLDFAQWAACMTEPTGGPIAPECEAFDFNADGDVDIGDYAGFQAVFAGL